MSTKTSSTAIYAMILTIGAMFIPLQFGFANTNTSTYHLQGVVGHVCDQTMSTIHVAGCSTGGSYRAVQDTQNTIPPDTNSSSGDTYNAYPATADRRHDAQ
jgi:hypothetical protein